MKKRILSLLLALVMLVGMIPATTLTAFAAAEGEVYVGGVGMNDGDYLAVGATTTRTTKPSGGYAYYNNGILTLNNYSYAGKGYQYDSEGGYYATVFADCFLTVELVGTNSLKQTASLSKGIRVGHEGYRELEIQGDGSLNVTSTHCGISAKGSIVVNGGTIISTATDGGGYKSSGIESIGIDVTIKGGNVTVAGDYGLWVPDGSCEIKGGTVTATGIEQAIHYHSSYGFSALEGMNIQASTTTDGELGEYVAANHDSYKKIVITPPEVWVGGVGMNDGDYLAVGAIKTQATKPSGGYAYYKDGTLTLNNYSYTGEGYYCNPAMGGSANISASNDIQIELVGTNNLTQVDYWNSACIWGEANVSLIGAGTLNLQNASWGIRCESDISIESGNLNIDTCDFGIYSTNQKVILNGGSFKIDAIKCAVAGESGIEINGGSGIFRNTQDSVYRVLHSQTQDRTVTIDPSLVVMASTTADGELSEYVAANLASYKKIVIESPAINTVNVSATWSGTPKDATTSTKGAAVTDTKWYKKNGSSWTELGASDTIKEGNTYRCEVTVAATDGYTLADGYTVKINGIAATKKSGNTWYRDVTITGISDYVEVNDIDLPEAYTNPDFTYDTSDVAPSRKHWDVVQVEWFECDKDGHKLSGALTENDVFKKDTYYRIEVTVVPETNWQFHGSQLSVYINDKAAMPIYGYNKAYPDSVTGYVVYNTADIEGDYELFVYDDSLSGSAKNIYIKDGQYLGSNATGATATKPASGGYAYYKDGVLELNGYDNEKAHFIFEEAALELWLIGDNTIGAIYDNEWGMAGGNLEVRQGKLVIDAADGGKLTIASNPLDAYANIQVKDLYFNGGELTSCLANDTYGAAVQLNGGNLYLENGYVAYVSDTNDFASATKWDGKTDISTYDCVWIVDEQATVTHTVTFKVDTTTVATKTVEDGKTVTAPADPTQSGKTFLGWYNGSTKFDFTTPITGDITLTAKFEDATSTVKLGDVDGNGKINMGDVTAIRKYLIDATSYPLPVPEAADVTGEGKINMADVTAIRKYLINSSLYPLA